MTNLLIIYLYAFCFIIMADGKMTYFGSTVYASPNNTLACLKTYGFLNESFIFTYYDVEKNIWYPVISPLDCESVAGTVPHLVLDLASIKWINTTPQIEAQKIAKQFSGIHLKKIWLSPSSFKYYYLSCSILQSFGNQLSKRTNLEVGIFSSVKIWTSVFGNSNACPQLASNFSLFLFELDNQTVLFGGWSRWDYAYFKNNPNFCGINQIEIRSS